MVHDIIYIFIECRPIFSLPYLGNGRATGMVVVRLSFVCPSRMYRG